MDINWSATGSIAQWVGAVFSGLAIYYAVKKNNPSIKLYGFLVQDLSGGEIRVTATNTGYIPVTIEHVAIRCNKYKKSYKRFSVQNDFAEPGKQVTIAQLKVKAFNDEGITDLRKMCELISAFDQFGNEYFLYNNLFSKIKRVFQIKLLGKRKPKETL